MARRDQNIGFVGIGVLAKGLALALTQRGYRVTAAYSRNLHSAQGLADRLAGCRVFTSAQELVNHTDLVFITTPDAAIGQVAAAVAWRRGQGVVLCSGALPLEVLRPAAGQGALVGRFHPFQTLGGLEHPGAAADRLQGVTFAVDGQEWLQEYLAQMAANLGGRAITVREPDLPLYHASAVLACGYLATLLQGAVSLWQEIGFNPQEAMDAIYPLARATLEGSACRPDAIGASITGPVVRGDVATVRAHLEALSQRLPELAPLYAALTKASLPLARERGVEPGQLADLGELADFYCRS